MVNGVRDGKLSALYVVGANPLKGRNVEEYRGRSFLVVEDLFLHETAEAADVFLPAAGAYEKSGTVTNTCGELQRLRKAMDVPGTRTDLDILSRLAEAMGAAGFAGRAEEILEEICRVVPGYQVSTAQLLSGGAEATLLPIGTNKTKNNPTAQNSVPWLPASRPRQILGWTLLNSRGSDQRTYQEQAKNEPTAQTPCRGYPLARLGSGGA
jgi:predicted molibdopterin-dependent oxidoreductase YjgC